jgi:hypothetical protein
MRRALRASDGVMNYSAYAFYATDDTDAIEVLGT